MDKVNIEKITLLNFKSFDKTEVKLNPFNVLVGPNASGKTQFLSALEFLRDVAKEGLDNAISMQGGMEYLQNTRLSKSKPTVIEVSLKFDKGPISGFRLINRNPPKSVGLFYSNFTYRFGLERESQVGQFKISEEKLTITGEVKEFPLGMLRSTTDKKISTRDKEFKLILTRKDKKLDMKIYGNLKNYLKEEESPMLTKDTLGKLELSDRRLIIEKQIIGKQFHYPLDYINFGAVNVLGEALRRISIYDIDPKLSKRGTQFTGRAELEHDGSNLSMVLKSIKSSKKSEATISTLVKSLLPFIDDIRVEKMSDKSLLTVIRETYSKSHIPAPLISDGTINLVAVLVALYSSKDEGVVAIEEPERNIHPMLMSKLVDMMKDLCDKGRKQIIISTHSPEIVKYAGLDQLLLIQRNKDGFSEISRPSDKEDVKTFLRNELGVEDLFVQNLL